jgi:hypothetical protein
MIGILLLYFIGKYFKTLAEMHKKKPWPWVILGIVIYFAGTFIGGIIIALLCNIIEYDLELIPDVVLNLLALPFGLLLCWIVYFTLEKNWKNNSAANDVETIDSELL